MWGKRNRSHDPHTPTVRPDEALEAVQGRIPSRVETGQSPDVQDNLSERSPCDLIELSVECDR